MSERDITAGVLALINGRTCYPILMVDADFPGDHVRLWSGVGELSWNSYVWYGMGRFMSYSQGGEGAGTIASSVTVGLNGFDSTILSSLLGSDFQGRKAVVYLAFLDAAHGSIEPDPITLFTGFMDSDEVTDDGKTASISITAENRLTDILRTRQYNYTTESQKHLYPLVTDTGFDFVPAIQDIEIPWGV